MLMNYKLHYRIALFLVNFSLFTHPYGNETFVFNINRLTCLFRMCWGSRNPSSLFLKGEESSQSDSKQAQGGWDDTNPTSLQRR